MARTKNIVSEEDLNLLKENLQQTFGKKISQSLHCIQLSQHIKATLGENVSAQTLRRIFGFITSPFTPSLTNLDILSKYCGYASFSDLTKTKASPAFQPLSSTDEASLYLNFYSIDLTDEADINYHNASRNIAQRILTNEVLFNQLAAPLAEHKTSQIFFYERFPFIDGLGTYYPRGIRFYLNNKKDVQAQIFGNSLLLMGAVLTNNKEEAAEQHNILSSFPVDKEYHPFVIARLLGNKLLYKSHFNNGEALENELKEVYVWAKYFSTPSKIKFWVYPYFQMMICNYLNLSGLYYHSEKVFQTISTLNLSYFQIEDGYKEILEIIRKISSHQGNEKAFVNWYKSFEGWNKISRIFKKFYRLQVLAHLHLVAAKKDKSIIEESQQLIDETGFTFFLKYFS